MRHPKGSLFHRLTTDVQPAVPCSFWLPRLLPGKRDARLRIWTAGNTHRAVVSMVRMIGVHPDAIAQVEKPFFALCSFRQRVVAAILNFTLIANLAVAGCVVRVRTLAAFGTTP